MSDEGWTFLWNSKKWHYFVDGRSLCGKWMLLGKQDYEQGNDNSPDNCAECRRKLMKRKEKLSQIKSITCPHCRRGKLVNPHTRKLNDEEPEILLYTCDVCSRGWHQDKDGNWHSHFAADVEVYTPDGKKLLDCSTWHLNERRKYEHK